MPHFKKDICAALLIPAQGTLKQLQVHECVTCSECQLQGDSELHEWKYHVVQLLLGYTISNCREDHTFEHFPKYERKPLILEWQQKKDTSLPLSLNLPGFYPALSPKGFGMAFMAPLPSIRPPQQPLGGKLGRQSDWSNVTQWGSWLKEDLNEFSKSYSNIVFYHTGFQVASFPLCKQVMFIHLPTINDLLPSNSIVLFGEGNPGHTMLIFPYPWQLLWTRRTIHTRMYSVKYREMYN